MAVTSKVSVTTNFPLRILNTGPSYIRDAPSKDHHKLGRKSAMERLAESRAKFVRTGSGEELDDAKGNENRTKPKETKISRVTASQESHVFKAVPYICGDDGNRSPRLPRKPRPRPAPPIPDASDVRKPEVTALRKGSRDRTLEIVAASLALSEKNNSSSDDDILNPSTSPREASSAGSRVRRLKEQFQAIGSAESESDTSQGRKTPTEKSGNSPKSFHSWKSGKETDHATIITFTKSRRPQLNVKSTETLKDSQEEVSNPATRGSSSSEDKSHQNERQLTVEPKANPLTDLTRRQIERFKAQHALKENCQERKKISKIVLKPRIQVAERKERSLTAIEPTCKVSSTAARERAHTSTDETDHCHAVPHLGKHSLGSPANPLHARHKHSQEIVTGHCTSRKMFHATNQEVTGAMKSDELARLMQSMEHESTELCTDTKPSGPRHPVHNVRDRVSKMKLESDDPKEFSTLEVNHRRAKSDLDHSNLARSSSEAKPDRVRYFGHDDQLKPEPEHEPTELCTDTKPSGLRHPVHHVRDRVSKMKLESDDPKEFSTLEVNHRRAKSDLDHSNLAKPNRVRHLSHDDQLKPEPDFPHQQIRKVSAPSVSHERVKSSPDTLENFQKKSWAPVSFNQNQEWVAKTSRFAQQEPRVSSTVVQTPRTHAPNKNLPRQLFSPVMHEQAKSTVNSFLSGVMSSPMRLENANDENFKMDNDEGSQWHDVIEDGNGNQIGMETSQRSRGNFNPTRPSTTCTDRSKDLNLNVNNLSENDRNPVEVPSQVASSRDVELTLMTSQEHPYERIKFAAQEPVSNVNERRGVGYPDKTKLRHVDLVDDKPRHEEFDRRSKFSQNVDALPSKHSRHGVTHHGFNETNTKAEEPRVKKISLADLLSKDNAQGVAEVGHTEGTEVRRDETEFKRHRLPSKSDRSHGEDSETDSDEELQRSKVLRVRKTRAENKKQDKSLQNLLSRIINPEDDLNTLKRGQKISDLKRSEQEATRQSDRDDTADALQSKPLLVKARYNATNITRPLLHLNIASKSKRQDAVVSPPASLTSPTRRDLLRRRSKSDLGMSPRCSVSSAPSETDYFFNQMGMNDSFFQGPLSPLHYSDEDHVFNNMHEYKHSRAGSFSTEEDSDNISRGSKVSNEGLHLAKKLPDASSSIITKNARVIKWLCQMRKARASSIS